MYRFEYQVRTFSVDTPEGMAEILNNLGQMGWQVCCRVDAPDGTCTFQFLMMRRFYTEDKSKSKKD